MSTPRLLITGSRDHRWTQYDSHALFLAVQEIVEKTHTHRLAAASMGLRP